MTADQAQMVEMWVEINGAAIVVLVGLSFASGWLILEGLDALDRRLRLQTKRRRQRVNIGARRQRRVQSDPSPRSQARSL